MYVLPFSMGPVGSPLSKVGVQVTDSAYVSMCMRIMTRLGSNVLDALGTDDFIRCLHSVGQPLPMQSKYLECLLLLIYYRDFEHIEVVFIPNRVIHMEHGNFSSYCTRITCDTYSFLIQLLLKL